MNRVIAFNKTITEGALDLKSVGTEMKASGFNFGADLIGSRKHAFLLNV